MQSTKKYPIGIQTFEKIIKGKCQYVDKTGYVYDIAQKYECVFLSRPRRFGKSLLTTTFESYFSGEKELFEGLEAGRLEKDWVKYPVLHFDMSTAKHADKEQLISELNVKLLRYEEIYGKVESEVKSNQRLEGLIRRAKAMTGHNVVILIDEYDAPLLDVLDDKDALEANRQVMRNFYSPLKACDADLRFVFMTGIIPFPRFTLSSELNNFLDISHNPKYAGICGFSTDELHSNFNSDINKQAGKKAYDGFIEVLRKNYGGYHFSYTSQEVICPYSVMRFFDSSEIGDYMFENGLPRVIKSLLRLNNFNIEEIAKVETMKYDFYRPIEDRQNLLPLLYRSGCVTIKDYDSETECYTLGIPNMEIYHALDTEAGNIKDWQVLE